MGLASSLLAACSAPPVDDPTRWTVTLHGADVFVYQPSPETGCLAPTDERLGAGTEVDVLGADARWLLLDRGFRLIRRDNILSEHPPAVPRPRPQVTVQRADPVHVFGADGCPTPSERAWAVGDVGLRLARVVDAQLRGFALIDPALLMAPARAVDGWDAPFEAGVQLLTDGPDGLIAGAGVLIDERTLLTVAHLGVDSSWCWTRGPDAQQAWDDGDVYCTLGEVVDHDRVDLRVVRLDEPAPGPFAPLRGTPIEEGDPFYVQRFGAGMARDFGDSTVQALGLNNADCAAWPYGSTFTSEDPLTGPADAGSPAYSGSELVGILHGRACFPVHQEAGRDTYVHLPGLRDFIDSVRGGA